MYETVRSPVRGTGNISGIRVLPLRSKYSIINSFLIVCTKSAELGVLMFNNCSHFHQFVFPVGDPAGPQYVEKWNKLVCPKFIL